MNHGYCSINPTEADFIFVNCSVHLVLEVSTIAENEVARKPEKGNKHISLLYCTSSSDTYVIKAIYVFASQAQLGVWLIFSPCTNVWSLDKFLHFVQLFRSVFQWHNAPSADGHFSVNLMVSFRLRLKINFYLQLSLMTCISLFLPCVQIDLEPEGKVFVVIDLSGSSSEGECTLTLECQVRMFGSPYRICRGTAFILKGQSWIPSLDYLLMESLRQKQRFSFVCCCTRFKPLLVVVWKMFATGFRRAENATCNVATCCVNFEVSIDSSRRRVCLCTICQVVLLF